MPRPRLRAPGFLGALRDRLRGARYFLEDVAHAVGSFGRALGRGLRGFWLGLQLRTRQRLAMALAAALIAAAFIAFAVPALPCEVPGGDSCPPHDDAVEVVPEDALAYVHVNVDPDTDQYDDARAVAERIPTITGQLIRRVLVRVPGPGGGAPDFARDIEPWFGGEAALAILPAGASSAEELQLLEASDDSDAEKFAESVHAGGSRTTDYHGVEVRSDRAGLATALVGDFLAIGTRTGVREAIDAERGSDGAGSLADDARASDARDTLPDKRLAEAYLSEDGIERLVADPRAPLATLAAFVDPGASTGAAAALVASDDGVELSGRSVLDPDRGKANPGFFTAFPTFEPSLIDDLPSDSLAYLGLGQPGRTLRSLLQQASAEEPGLSEAVAGLVDRVKELGNVDLERDLLPSLGGEAAFALEPAPPERRRANRKQQDQPHIAPPPGPGEPVVPPGAEALPAERTPVLEFVGAGIDEERAGQALARLQGPIAKALNPESGLQAPVFGTRKIDDVTAHSLRLSPTVNLTYAIASSVLVIATDPSGIEELAAGEGGLSGTDLFENATDGFPDDPSTLGYLDLRGLLALGERAGLAEDPAYATFAPELRKLEALGVAVRTDASRLESDARLLVGTGPETAGDVGVAPSD